MITNSRATRADVMTSRFLGLLVVGLFAGPMEAGTATVANSLGGGVTAGVLTSLHSSETQDANSDSFASVPTPLDQRAYAISGSLSSEYVEGNTHVTADWITPDQGTVEFHLDGSINATCCGNGVYNTARGLDDWYYAFEATTDGVLRLEYTLTGSGTGSGGFRININGDNVANLKTPDDGTTLSGSQDFPLVSGQTYTFALNNFAGFSTTAETLRSYVSSGVFTFEILPPQPDELLEDLIEEVIDLNVHAGIGNALDSKLQNALAALDRAKAGDTASAIAILQSFINSVEAQRGKSLTDEQADALIAAAQAIIDSLS